MVIPLKRKRYRYNYCQECGKPMKDLNRHGHAKVCSEICKIMWAHKWRHKWWVKRYEDAKRVYWNSCYELLKAYRAEYPNLWPLAKTKYKGVSIGHWCRQQRKKKENKTITQDQKRLLDEIGFLWDQREVQEVQREVYWNSYYELLKAYRVEYPNLWPVHNESYHGFNLGSWYQLQCHRYKYNTLPLKYKLLLEKIGFSSKISKKYLRWRARWRTFYNLLKKYHDEKPFFWPDAKEKYKGVNLGQWCYTQRKNKKQNKLLPIRVQLLNEIGFIWDAEKAYWNSCYELLKQYRKYNSNIWPSDEETYYTYNLGEWCKVQKILKKLNKLDSEHEYLLNKIGFKWDIEETQWENYYELLKKFREENPNTWPKCYQFYEGFPLGQWCMELRQRKKYNSLAPEQERLLNEINFAWALKRGRPRKD